MERATVMKTLRDRDASFSSYLRPDKSTITCSQPHPRVLEDSTSELSIFDAHKYFNEVTINDNNIQKVTISSNSRVSPMENIERIPERGDVITETTTPTTTTRYSSASSSVDGYANIRNSRARSVHAATPTASSEASWNSQTGLLSHPPGAIPVSMKNPQNQNPNDLNNKLRTSLSKPIWLLRRKSKCPCTGKKSVQVKEITPQPKTNIQRDYSLKTQDHGAEINVHNHITPNNWVVDQTAATLVAAKSQRFQNPNTHRVVSSVRVPFTDGFTFPVLNPHGSVTKLKVPNVVVEEDPPRDSLEVFRPPDDIVEPKPLNFPFPPKSLAVVVDDDAASDASSDLFEIESFSTATQSTYPAVYRRNSRDSMDEGSTTPTITECYEPSEASIEWSVTTVEGHDDAASGVGVGGVAAEEKWKRRGGNGLLVSCRCEKAVSVGPQPVKCGSEGQRGATSSTHVNLIVNGNSLSSSSSSRIGCVNKAPLSRPHRNAPRVSHAFAT
ncbi:protein PHYTOCHROME KINASE SUBSTRATE 4-like [Abrus precatorius]|uniref:Protein PHYTOCHROME KINASE SUBSTRATE 4-like n=1 Tax=Abrus precatorius TaxID=3816 RepID=A0A8B8L6V6_ABRPR|nr:protein PHYTOCHROME KINASE SUBSTRATE 4-like [Abrus precatorius]